MDAQANRSSQGTQTNVFGFCDTKGPESQELAHFFPIKKQENLHHLQWHSQNAEKVTHIKGRLLYQAMVLYNYVPFQFGTSLKGKNSFPGGVNSFV